MENLHEGHSPLRFPDTAFHHFADLAVHHFCALQDCWNEDASKRPRFEDIIISLRGLLESAANRHKLQKTLTGTTPYCCIALTHAALPHCTPNAVCSKAPQSVLVPHQHRLGGLAASVTWW